MEELILLEEHASFAEANSSARSLSKCSEHSALVRRIPSGWGVFGTYEQRDLLLEAQELIDDPPETEEDYDDWLDKQWEHEMEHEVLRYRREDLASGMDDAARSDEEGWMYSDVD